MPTIFAKWNAKSLKPLTQPRFGQGISSADLHSGTEDAKQLKDDVAVNQHLEAKSSPLVSAPANKTQPSESQGPDIPAWRVASQQPLPDPLSEFGASSKIRPAQRANTGRPRRRSNEHRALYSSSTVGVQPSKSIRKDLVTDNSSNVTMQPPSYGYTTYGWETPMDVTRATEIVLACGQQIRATGLDWPLIFSSMALDLSSHSVTFLLQSLVKTPAAFLSSEVQFANPHDLAAVIKWTLSRLGKVVPVSIPSHDHSRKGNITVEETVLVQQRGFLEWDLYLRWSTQERAKDFPLDAFSAFLDQLSSSSLALLVAVFSLLSSTTSYSPKNGMTPSRLSRLFGVLLFGLPEDETFEKTYEAFVRAGNATEHLLLAYIRNCSATEAIPTRLVDHIKEYPNMLSDDINRPSRSVRGVPITHVNRTVRLYSLDLIEAACEMDVAVLSDEWKACCSTSDIVGKDPQFSDRYRKLINLRGGSKQGRGQRQARDRSETEPTEAYGSLVDKQWGDFMNEGFSAPDQSKLAFDLKESERKARRQRPESVQWDTFEQSGFVQKDDGLASVLSFDESLRDEMERWPAERAELMEKLRKTNKMMPAFPYDTTPYVVSSPTLDRSTTGQWASKPVSRMDEVFAEVYADIILGNGWSNRDEQTHRNANFVVVQYKSRPTESTDGSQAAGSPRQSRGYIAEADNRTDAAWFVIEEIVPAKYRSEMEASGRAKGRNLPSIRKLNIFKKRKDEKMATPSTQNVPPTSSFEELFRPGLGGLTKKVQLNKDPATTTPLTRNDSGSTVRQSAVQGGEDPDTGTGKGQSKLISIIKNNSTSRSKSMRLRKKPEVEAEQPPLPPSQPKGLAPSPSFGSEDFDTRSLHDPESDAFAQDRSGKHSLLKGTRNAKRVSKDDTWLDVMIKANGFRMAGQDASMGASKGKDEQRLTPTAIHADVSAADSSSFHSMTPPAHATEDGNPAPITAVKRKMVPEDDGASQISQQSLQAAGWTVEGEPGTVLSSTPPRRGSVESREVAPPITDPSPLMGQVSTGPADVPETAPPSSDDPNSKLTHLLALPPRQVDSDNKEMVREARIQAAKNRAKELRANLNPVAAQELESRKEAKTKTGGTALEDGSGSQATQQRLAPKDNPFVKDRFSGRVANVASKFGGGLVAAKPITPQSTGSSVAPVSPNPGTSSFVSNVDKKLPPIIGQHPVHDPDDPSGRRSADYSTTDVDSIFPEDAASNYSRDTNIDDDMKSSSLRPGGSIAASNTQFFDQSADNSRLEDEDQHTNAMPSFRVPYQPGMPLSNLEEESESVLSGSNL